MLAMMFFYVPMRVLTAGEKKAFKGTEKPSLKTFNDLILYFQIISLLVSMTAIKWIGLLHKILTFY